MGKKKKDYNPITRPTEEWKKLVHGTGMLRVGRSIQLSYIGGASFVIDMADEKTARKLEKKIRLAMSRVRDDEGYDRVVGKVQQMVEGVVASKEEEG